MNNKKSTKHPTTTITKQTQKHEPEFSCEHYAL
jgi:hypothetical protein